MASTALDPKALDDLFAVIGHRHRRFVLADLSRGTPPIDVGGLAERIANWEWARAESRHSTRDQIEIELHHRHLPKLDEVGLLTYGQSRRAVLDWPDLELPDGWVFDPSIEPLLAVSRDVP